MQLHKFGRYLGPLLSNETLGRAKSKGGNAYRPLPAGWLLSSLQLLAQPHVLGEERATLPEALRRRISQMDESCQLLIRIIWLPTWRWRPWRSCSALQGSAMAMGHRQTELLPRPWPQQLGHRAGACKLGRRASQKASQHDITHQSHHHYTESCNRGWWHETPREALTCCDTRL